jgi:hypothetical protein
VQSGRPPQTGKSWTVTDFIAWVAGNSPDKKTIFGSFSDDLGVRTNLDLQRIMATRRYRKIFPDLGVDDCRRANDSRADGDSEKSCACGLRVRRV